jgi:four helix bundle protein
LPFFQLKINNEQLTMPKDNVLKEKSYSFALRIVKLYQYMCTTKHEFTLSKQILRSGTAVGALVYEGECAQSKPDFISKLNIALKEANETGFWLMLLKDSGYISDKNYSSIAEDCKELIKLLTRIIKTSKANIAKNNC